MRDKNCRDLRILRGLGVVTKTPMVVRRGATKISPCRRRRCCMSGRGKASGESCRRPPPGNSGQAPGEVRAGEEQARSAEGAGRRERSRENGGACIYSRRFWQYASGGGGKQEGIYTYVLGAIHMSQLQKTHFEVPNQVLQYCVLARLAQALFSIFTLISGSYFSH